MKTKSLILLCASVSLWPILTGCSSWPKDSFIRDGKVTTLWGTVSVGAAATGSAARSLSATERADLLNPIKP